LLGRGYLLLNFNSALLFFFYFNSSPFNRLDVAFMVPKFKRNHQVKRTDSLLDHLPRMSVFHQERTGFVTIKQEYYAFIQRESVLLTWWFLLNLGTIKATSSLNRLPQQKSYIPNLFLAEVYKSYQKLTLNYMQDGL
jgi:hypothetical protein